MTTPTTTDYLKYANLQMAAEAFLATDSGEPKIGTDFIKALTDGNLHASKFTETQAKDFADHWIAVDQRINSGTGFSGTLFKCIQDDPITGAKAGELVLSFRSTEFIDEARNGDGAQLN